MHKFEFSMQKILDLREFEKKQAEIDLGKAVAEETRIKKQLEDIAQKKADGINTADSYRDLRALYNINNYFVFLEQKTKELTQELCEVQIVTEQKREVMREAIKNCKVLENLKESRYKEWKKKSMKIEENEIDDLVTARYK